MVAHYLTCPVVGIFHHRWQLSWRTSHIWTTSSKQFDSASKRDYSNMTQIHLHGHDFAILQQSNVPLTPSSLKLKLDNPPRRDVALLPQNGFLVLAFKTDNPGNWLLHCHIARHASGGLALQVLERQADAYHLFGTSSSPAMPGISRVCNTWKTWFSNCNNWWAGCSAGSIFQGDSGI